MIAAMSAAMIAAMIPALGMYFVTLFEAGFPVGTYTNCAQGIHHASGSQFLNVAGFEDGARLTLVQSGTTLISTYVDQNGTNQSLRFSKVADTVAAIEEKGQVLPGFTSLCVLGPGRQASSPARLTVTAGALSSNAGMVFLNVTGGLESDSKTCGNLLQSRATFWVGCMKSPGDSAGAVGATVPLTRLPAGKYSCSTQVETLSQIGGVKQYDTGGATGMLTLTQDGAKMTAHYSGDPALTGTLRLASTTSTTAQAEPGQTLMAPCANATGAGGLSRKGERVRVAAGTLTFIESTLFLSFAGVMAETSPCPSTQVAGSLICLK